MKSSSANRFLPSDSPSVGLLAVVGLALLPPVLLLACVAKRSSGGDAVHRLSPTVVTQQVAVDPDDPAIWVHPTDSSQSLILGTDKGGFLYVFDLEGRVLADKTVSGLGRVNNVDVEYGLQLGDEQVDIAVATDRHHRVLRVYRLPEMEAIDGGGLRVFNGQEADYGAPMGVALYRRQADSTIFAIVSRKSGPSDGYLWQYRLEDAGNGRVTGTKVRELGRWSGAGEIESIAVDDELGYVYYADEEAGVRKYHADPDAPEAAWELAFFATDGFGDDREGISIYPVDERTGYILVNDQETDRLRIFRREGAADDPHRHELVKVVDMSTVDSDGCEVTSASLSDKFAGGMFVAMSDNGTFHYYSWESIAGADLLRAPRGSGADAGNDAAFAPIYLLASIVGEPATASCRELPS